MKCLNCGTGMVNILFESRGEKTSYDVCRECGSLWLDAGELNKMAEQVPGDLEICTPSDETPPSGKKECPRCPHMPLEKVRFLTASDILLDRCPNCGGFFLDGGELDLINRELENILPVEEHGFWYFVSRVHLPYWRKRVKPSTTSEGTVPVGPAKYGERKGETERECPCCKKNLQRYEAFGMGLDYCESCGGTFLEIAELRVLKDRVQQGNWVDVRWMDDELEAIDSAQALPSDRECPGCAETMATVTFGKSTVLLDYCRKCHALWLDAGDFHAMLQYLNEEASELSPEERRERLMEELKEVWNGSESLLSELGDTKAAVSTYINLTIFDHPRLVQWLLSLTGLTH